ncbi:Uncharacterised protein [uncultured archaeon]|nr:Uncharacterised protein [uncultured archaeon]
MQKNLTIDRFEILLESAVQFGEGNRIRHLADIIAKSYSKKPEELISFFSNDNKHIAGIATSAYYSITEDIEPALSIEYGGLGAVVASTKIRLKIGQSQFLFSRNSGNAFWFSENSGNAFGYSENSGDSFRSSMNRGESFKNSINQGESFQDSENCWNSFEKSTNKGYSLWGSRNNEHSFYYSDNSENAARGSTNDNYSFCRAKIRDNALKGAKKFGNSFWRLEGTKEPILSQ